MLLEIQNERTFSDNYTTLENLLAKADASELPEHLAKQVKCRDHELDKELLNNKLANFPLRFGANFVHLIERYRRNISDILKISRLKMDKICSKDGMKIR